MQQQRRQLLQQQRRQQQAEQLAATGRDTTITRLHRLATAHVSLPAQQPHRLPWQEPQQQLQTRQMQILQQQQHHHQQRMQQMAARTAAGGTAVVSPESLRHWPGKVRPSLNWNQTPAGRWLVAGQCQWPR